MDGLARAAHDRTVARGAALVRALTISVGTLFLVVWHSWYAEHPARLALPVLVLAWDLAFCAWSWRHGLTLPLITADVAGVAVLAAFSGLLVPGDTVGDGSNWAYVAISVTTVTAGAALPAAGWMPVCLVTAVAYWAGSEAVGPSGPAPGAPVRSGLTLVALCAVFAVAVTVQRRHADDADARLAAIAVRRRADAADEARVLDRREQERLLHDTILNTLTGIAWGAATGGGRAAVSARCASDVTELENFLATEPPHGAQLWAMLQTVVDQAQQPGLAVTLHDGAGVRDGRDPDSRAPDTRDPGRTPPWEVRPELAAAVRRALAEALANVARHSGADRAEVVATRAGPDRGARPAGQAADGPDGPGEVRPGDEPTGGTVTITDAGRGFDPRAVADDRLGVRRSVIERMADAGGTATVDSTPGLGTIVTLRWDR